MIGSKPRQSSHNKERHIVRIIREICEEQGISCESFSYDWIFKLCKDDWKAFVIGYDFGLNSSASARICDDKCAAYAVLSNAGVPAVEHFLYMSPSNMHYIGVNGNWARLGDCLMKHGRIVCKVNEGTGGNNVFLVENKFQLEQATHKIFKTSRTMAVSPFYNIEREYRAIVLDGDVKLLYSKNIPSVVGDGRQTVFELLSRYVVANKCRIDFGSISNDVLFSVLPYGEGYRAGWKFNLGQGALPQALPDGDKRTRLAKLAVHAAKALSVRLASIDIIETNDGMRILEVNNGIMMERFIQAAKENYHVARDIYRQVVQILVTC